MTSGWARLPRRLGRRVAGRVAGRVGRRLARQRPVVSVVVPVHDVEGYLAACLDSLLGQTFAELEVIAVDDGSTDASPTILREYAARDPRLRVISQANAGQGPARNAGVALARGEFLMFVDGDDVVPADALAAMVATLRRTGSDFVVGAAQRFTHRRDVEVAFRFVHDRDRLSTTLEDFPDAILDIIACNRLFRTAFWRERVPPFEAGIAYEDHVPMLMATVRAGRFDVLARVVYRWRIRTDGSSTSQQKGVLGNLEDRIAVKEQARRLLAAEASASVRDAWVARTIDIDYQPFLRYALGGDPAYRERLSATLRAIFAEASDAALDRMRFSPKVRAWLAAQGDWAGLDEAEEWFREQGNRPRGVVSGGRLVARPVPEPSFLAAVPERLRALAPHETPLAAAVRGARWDGTRLLLDGYVAVRGLDASTRPPEVAAWLVAGTDPGTDPGIEADDAGRLALPVTMSADPLADVWARDAAVSYRHGRFETAIDLADLAALAPGAAGDARAADGERRWRLRLQVGADGLRREDGLHQVVDGSAVSRLGEHAVDGPGGPLVADTVLEERGFAVRLRPGTPRPPAPRPRRLLVHALELDTTRLTMRVEARGLDARDLRTAALEGTDLVLAAVAAQREDDLWRLDFDLMTTVWGRASVVPRGGLRLVAGERDDLVVAEPGPVLATELPQGHGAPLVRVTARMRPTGALGLLVGPPLSDEERSPAGQLRLRSLPTAAPDPGVVLLEAFSGERADGGPLALDRALARLRPTLRRVWSIRSGDVPVPDDAEVVVHGTRQWHELLRTAGTLVTDDDLEPWFEPAAGQRWIVTGRGHPAKAMGAAYELEQGDTPGGAARALARRNRAWSVLLAGSPEAERLYRADLGFTGRILTVGDPQTDPLCAGERERLRAQARARLGIEGSEVVALYAPTYRDTPVDRIRSAPLPRDLDLASVQERAGVRVLLRAHPDDAHDAAAWARSSGVLDVTTYPRLAELLLAADVAILDHSAIRFAWALTGRPAICFLPDRAAYETHRRPLIPYEQTAPGPIVTRGDEVVALLRDLPALGAACAPLGAAVAARFAPLDDGAAGDRVVAALF